MGKKSRLKKERRKDLKENQQSSLPPPFLTFFIKYFTFVILLTPLIVSGRFYFPFVGPKSLFFMGGVEILFFCWLILILNYRRYLPKPNKVLFGLGLFLLVLILSAILGVDFSRSF